MEKLSELIGFLSRHKLKGINSIGGLSKSNSLLSQLYSGIHDKIFFNEEVAAKALYNSSPSNKNFKKLKYQLERRIINNIFFIDLNDSRFSDRQRAGVSCRKNWAAARILLGRGARASGIHLAEKTLRTCLKYDYTALSLDIARSLNTHYSLHRVDRKKQLKFSKIIDELQELFIAEILSEKYYAELRSEFAKKRGAFDEKLVRKAKKYSKELKEKFPGLRSKDFTFHSNLVHIMRYEFSMDYDKLVIASEKANKEFLENNDKNGIIGNNLRILIALITLKRFLEAEKLFDEIIPNYPEGNYYWFIINELRIIFSFYTKNYQQALKIQIKVGRHKGLRRLPVSMQYGWKLHEAYIHFFIRLGLIDTLGFEDKLKTFKLSRFLNNIPEGAKDKEGINIQILIIQVIFLLKDDKIDQAINRMQVLHQYTGKYLKKDHTYRSNVFIKMLIVLIRNQMHREAVIRKSAKYLKMLKDNPIEKSKQSIGIEVVPFEDLWELIIADTKNEFRFTPAKVKKIEAAFGSGKRGRKSSK